MSKYIIDITLDNIKKVVAMGVTKGGAIWTDTTDIENLEELNSDYINEHFGDLQEDAYKMGIAIGCADGRDELRKAIISITEMDNDTREKRFGYAEVIDILVHHSASKIIKKMKDNDKIEVGDEVYCKDDDVSDSGVVTWVGKDSIYAMWHDGSAGEVQKDELVKTGRHFDIASILEDMRHD